MQYNDDTFEAIRRRGEEHYRNFKPVLCPYLKRNVHFGAPGLAHLKFKHRDHARNHRDQHMRFKLLYLAPEVLKLSRTVQGILHAKRFERIRMHSRTETKLVSVTYYEFIAVLDSSRVKVIVKEIDGNEPFFWSFIPSWRIKKGIRKRRLHAGDPENG